MKRKEIENVLENCEFFRGLGKRDVSKISGLCRLEAYESGESVFHQSSYGEHLYVIAEGSVNLERSVDLGARKGNIVIETLGKGRVLGCWSTLLGMPHILMSSATCLTPTNIVAMNGASLRAMMVENPKLGFNVMERLSFLLRDRIQAAYGAMEKI